VTLPITKTYISPFIAQDLLNVKCNNHKLNVMAKTSANKLYIPGPISDILIHKWKFKEEAFSDLDYYQNDIYKLYPKDLELSAKIRLADNYEIALHYLANPNHAVYSSQEAARIIMKRNDFESINKIMRLRIVNHVLLMFIAESVQNYQMFKYIHRHPAVIPEDLMHFIRAAFDSTRDYKAFVPKHIEEFLEPAHREWSQFMFEDAYNELRSHGQFECIKVLLGFGKGSKYSENSGSTSSLETILTADDKSFHIESPSPSIMVDMNPKFTISEETLVGKGNNKTESEEGKPIDDIFKSDDSIIFDENELNDYSMSSTETDQNNNIDTESLSSAFSPKLETFEAELLEIYKEINQAKSVSFKNLLIGAFIQVIEVSTLGQPFEVLKTYMAANREANLRSAIVNTYKRGGLQGYYQGLIPWAWIEAASKGGILLFTSSEIEYIAKALGASSALAGIIGGICQAYTTMGFCTFMKTVEVTRT
ncbi:hypothetical protein ROZALSC1DRAFT_31394, partial [Rozella allomycis CSF55]